MSEGSTELPVSVARERFADIVSNAAYRNEITYVTRHGKRVAAIVPISVLEGRSEHGEIPRRGTGAALKELLARHEPDPTWGADLAELRAEVDEGGSPWDGV
jgi:prevent-host-death family protein